MQAEAYIALSSTQAVRVATRVATRYAPTPLLPCGCPSASSAAEQAQRSSSFPRPIRSHGHRCTCLTR